jgi:hypothetical protein
MNPDDVPLPDPNAQPQPWQKQPPPGAEGGAAAAGDGGSSLLDAAS